ncbi:hypothetical protein B0H13DRAFT_1857084 [Mycena leptocephala]|nr:hypothetical protein B0H13DRAFT_1857084 [Mycena leptocephala]
MSRGNHWDPATTQRGEGHRDPLAASGNTSTKIRPATAPVGHGATTDAPWSKEEVVSSSDSKGLEDVNKISLQFENKDSRASGRVLLPKGLADGSPNPGLLRCPPRKGATRLRKPSPIGPCGVLLDGAERFSSG